MCVVEPNIGLTLRWSENERITDAVGALGRLRGAPDDELNHITGSGFVADSIERKQHL